MAGVFRGGGGRRGREERYEDEEVRTPEGFSFWKGALRFVFLY
jgi:hypothetical protein